MESRHKTFLAAALATALLVAGLALGWDRLRPVGPPGSRARSLYQECRAQKGDARQACLLAGFEKLLADSGVAATMASLKVMAARDRRLEREGHVYAHGVGIKAYLASKNVPSTFNQCPTDFASGCGHGVIQAYLESLPALDSIAINDLCQPYRGRDVAQWRLFQCVHGIGHGLVMMYGGELPEALTTCDALRDGWDRDSCYGGAFMENIMRTTAPHHPASELAASHHAHQTYKSLDSTDLLYPCSTVDGRYHYSCYQIQTAAILHFTKGKIGPAAEACDGAPEAMRAVCYSSLGRDISSKAMRSPGRSIRYCDESGERYREWCYFGAAKALVDWEAKPAAGFAMCRKLGNRPGANLCFQAVGEQVASLKAEPADRARGCEQAGSSRGIKACLWGAKVPGATEPEKES